MNVVGILLTVLFFGFVVGGFVSWGYCAWYMYKTMTCYQPQRSWGRLLFFSPLFGWFFTAEGNRYRIRLLKSLVLFVGCVAAALGTGFLAGHAWPSP